MKGDLFGDRPRRVRVIRNPQAYAGRPGEGPGSRTCGDCRHLWSHKPNRRRYYKCGKVRATKGAATDIRKHMPACEFFEPRLRGADEA